MIKKLIFYSLIVGSFSSCVTVREYEKVKINDADMALTIKKSDRFTALFQSYREAASGANGGKTGGGCGCN
ncbi:MAG: DUF4266 domain-containing protein [Bacteroidales bacterium]|jgi:hypothetical protein|nr:DUF4266 domain-containing protein [Bacteroidales bacterium]